MGSPSPQKFGRKKFALKPNSLRIFGERGSQFLCFSLSKTIETGGA